MIAVYSKSLDRDAIFEAYQNRRVYGTSNACIRLLFTGNGKLIGSEIPNTSQKTFEIDVTGEGPLKKIDLFRNGELFKRYKPTGMCFKLTDVIQDAESSNWYVRITQQDNYVAISSPIWFD